MKCPNCQGDGWYVDHSDRHYGTGDSETCEQAGCPVQRECEYCEASGKVADDFTMPSGYTPTDDDLPF